MEVLKALGPADGQTNLGDEIVDEGRDGGDLCESIMLALSQRGKRSNKTHHSAVEARDHGNAGRLEVESFECDTHSISSGLHE